MDTRTGAIIPGGLLDELKKQAEDGPSYFQMGGSLVMGPQSFEILKRESEAQNG